jgi:hypothetical protein
MDLMRLVVQGPARRVYTLDGSRLTIGRDEANDVVVDDPYVSRHHAEIVQVGEGYQLRDLGSQNGTLLNGKRLTEPASVYPGDRVTLGRISLSFQAGNETLPLTPPPPPGLVVDTVQAKVWVEGREVQLTAKEYLALRLLHDKQGGLCTKDELAQGVWPEYQGGVGDYNIEQLISRLRRKLEADPDAPHYLLTVRGLGYRLESR